MMVLDYYEYDERNMNLMKIDIQFSILNDIYNNIGLEILIILTGKYYI